MSSTKNVPKRSSTTKEKVPTRTSSKKKDIENEEARKKSKDEKKSKEDNEPPIKKTTSKPNTIASIRKNDDKPLKSTTVPPKTKTSNLNKSKTSGAPSTATTSKNRVKTTQYFPSKNLFSNALKSIEKVNKVEETHPKRISRNTTEKSSTPRVNKLDKPSRVSSIKKIASSTTNSPKLEKKIIKSKTPRDSSPETSSTLERPRTATLSKGIIVNENIVGPEAPKVINNVIKETENQEDEKNSYEDDFDSYESDFEAASSSDNIPSGPTSSSTSTSTSEDIDLETHSPTLKDNKLRLSSAGTDGERKLDSGTFELSDFKHRQIMKYIEDTVKKEDAIIEHEAKCSHHSLSDEGFEDQKSLQFINFAAAKKVCEKRKVSAARRKRGQELLNMIKLDSINFTIFDSPSVPYEDFITNYGKGNMVQISSQTGDDAIDEEIQTEPIKSVDKWTQMPNEFSTFDFGSNEAEFWKQYKCELKGVGDVYEDADKDLNENRLVEFLKQSEELILQILSEECLGNINNLKKNKQDLPFSNGYLEFNTSGQTKVKNITIHPKNIRKVLTVHTSNENDSIKSMVCIWDIDDVNSPRTILGSFGNVSCAAFSLDNDKYVFGGQEDGAVLVWDVKENYKKYDILNRTPVFITPLGSGHVSKITCVQLIQDAQNNEICTLDETGVIIIWTLYSKADSIVLINNQIINLQSQYPHLPDILCNDCIIMDNHIYVSSNYGFIFHYLIRSSQNSMKMFIPESKIDAICLEKCPFSTSHFMAGYSNGDISLFSNLTERPLLVLQNKEQIDSSSIQLIQWSQTKPFIFYAKDSKNTLHIWDLSKSDMYPEYSIEFPEKICSMKLSAAVNVERKELAYMLIGTEDGKIYLHLLKDEYGQEPDLYKKQVEIFLNYVNRL